MRNMLQTMWRPMAFMAALAMVAAATGCPTPGSPLRVKFGYMPKAPEAGQTIRFRGDATVLPPLVLVDKEKFRGDPAPVAEEPVTIVGFAWDFGDGTQAQGRNATHAYAAAGRYRVCLTVTLSNGLEQTACKWITIPDTTNSPPNAVAQANPPTQNTGAVQLDGSQSSDPDGDNLTYSWEFVSRPAGSNAQLDDPNAVSPSFTADKKGDYVLRLTVSDSQAQDSDVTVTVSITNERPVAVATAPETYRLDGQQEFKNGIAGVVLDGTQSSDPDGTVEEYAWEWASRPTGSNAALENADMDTANYTPDLPGTYTAQLVVTDNDGAVSLPATASTLVTGAPNQPPVAVIDGPDEVFLDYPYGGSMYLTGYDSYDPDGDAIVSYLWSIVSKPAESALTLGDATMDTQSLQADLPGEYIFQLVVSDGQLDSAPTQHTVTVPPPNQPPMAIIYGDTPVDITDGPAATTLFGDESYDEDGEILMYFWAFVSKPAGSTAALSPSDEDQTSFTADLPGEYIVELTVTDDDGASDSTQFTVNVYTENQPPQVEAGDPQRVCQWTEVQLEGSATDPDEDDIFYLWVLDSGPEEARSYIRNPGAPGATFVPGWPGVYTLRLYADNVPLDQKAADVPSDTVQITVDEPAPATECLPYADFLQGPTDYEIEMQISYSNELPRHRNFVDAPAMNTVEISNCFYATVLNYALQMEYLENELLGKQAYTGGDVYFNGVPLLNIAAEGEDSEFCDIDFEPEDRYFYVALHDGKSVGDHPVVEVTWHGALAFCNWLSEMNGLSPYYNLDTWQITDTYAGGWRLPFESEWEFAAAWEPENAETKQIGRHWIFGDWSDDLDTTEANYNQVNPIGFETWPYTTPVAYYSGSQSPWYCWDMSGNVWEWVYEEFYEYAPPSKGTTMMGKIIRGGGWLDEDVNELRTARRDSYLCDRSRPDLGFRIVRYDENCAYDEKKPAQE